MCVWKQAFHAIPFLHSSPQPTGHINLFESDGARLLPRGPKTPSLIDFFLQVVDLNKIVAALPQQVLDAVEKSVGPLPPGELPVLDLQTVVQDVQGGVANAEASTPTEEAQVC